jgi:trehalose-6-phosphatase
MTQRPFHYLVPIALRIDEVSDSRPPIAWHKRSALVWIADRLSNPTLITVFVGDDRTNEDAFRFLKGAITAKVGNHAATSATYQVEARPNVARFLGWLANLGEEDANL